MQNRAKKRGGRGLSMVALEVVQERMYNFTWRGQERPHEQGDS